MYHLNLKRFMMLILKGINMNFKYIYKEKDNDFVIHNKIKVKREKERVCVCMFKLFTTKITKKINKKRRISVVIFLILCVFKIKQ